MNSSAIRVLLVEDDDTYAEQLRRELTQSPNAVELDRVRSASEGVRRLGGRTYDAVLLDLELPDAQGLETVGRLVATASPTPVIVLTGHPDEDEASRAVLHGAQDYLPKAGTSRAVLLRSIRYARERAAYRQELANRERYFRALTEQAYDMVVVLSTSGMFLYESPAVQRVLGYAPGTLTGTSVTDIVHPEDRERAAQLLRGWPDSIVATDFFEFRLRHQDGSWRVIEALGRTLYDDPANGIVVNARDITDRVGAEDALRAAEEQLRQAQKMEAVGRLAGGIAHDFNNVLTAIFGYSDLLLDQLDEADPRRADVQEIRRAADRAATLTRQLLAFSRKQVMQPRVIDLNDVVINIEGLLTRLVGEDVSVTVTPEPHLWKVRADPGQIEQVLMNLAANARDAMPEGGRLTIETRNASVDQQAAHGYPGLAPGAYAAIVVADTGSGMSPAVARHIFEPFFTTKEQGKGTGLGLATVYGIVKQSGGGIYVDSEEGKGSTFRIFLPRVDPE